MCYLFSSKQGQEFSLGDVLQPSIDNPKSKINLVAANNETILKYRETFRNYVNYIFQEDISKPFESDSLPMVKSLAIGMQEFFENYCTEIQITTNRNIIDFEFTPSINQLEREKLKEYFKNKIEMIEEEVFKMKGNFKENSEKISDTVNKNKNILSSAGVFRDWPNGRLIYKNNKDAFTCFINEEDHLKMTMNTKNPSHMTNDILFYFDFLESIEKKVIFAYDKYLGYLNCLSSNLGNGTYYYIKLRIKDDPTIISEIRKKLNENIKEISIDILKEEGKAIIQLSNKNPYFGFSAIMVEILGIKEYLERLNN